MTTVTVFTAERMAEIEAQAVVGAELVDGHIIFERHNGTTFDGGEIDITVLGNLAFAKDTEVFYIYQESADPLSLSANVQTPLSGTIMDVSDGDPSWGHWDADDTDAHFIIDEAGFYNVYTYAVIDSTGSSTGRSTLHISGTLGSNEVEFTHMTGQDARLVCQLTAMYDVGDGIRADVMSTVNALELTYAEIYIQKCNITMEGTAESSGGGGGGPDPFVKAVKGGEETVQTHGNTGSTETIDLIDGNVHVITQDMACTYTFTNPESTTTACSFTLIMTAVTGASTWPASVNWPSGTAPTLTGRCVLTFVTVNGGTDWDGFLSGSGMA